MEIIQGKRGAKDTTASGEYDRHHSCSSGTIGTGLSHSSSKTGSECLLEDARNWVNPLLLNRTAPKVDTEAKITSTANRTDLSDAEGGAPIEQSTSDSFVGKKEGTVNESVEP